MVEVLGFEPRSKKCPVGIYNLSIPVSPPCAMLYFLSRLEHELLSLFYAPAIRLRAELLFRVSPLVAS